MAVAVPVTAAEPVTVGAEPVTAGAEPVTTGATPLDTGAVPLAVGAVPLAAGCGVAIPLRLAPFPAGLGAGATAASGEAAGAGEASGAGLGDVTGTTFVTASGSWARAVPPCAAKRVTAQSRKKIPPEGFMDSKGKPPSCPGVRGFAISRDNHAPLLLIQPLCPSSATLQSTASPSSTIPSSG